ncbi:hypothetical protein Dimus_015096 [Dionaea muscipula]
MSAATTLQAAGFPPPASSSPPPPPGGVFYPTSITTTQPTSPGSNGGSFGVVFIVLAVIIVVSAGACFLGRICSKRYQKRTSLQPPVAKKLGNSHDNHTKLTNKKNQIRQSGPGRAQDRDLEFGFRSKEGDIELGFEKRVQMSKPPPSAMKFGEARGYNNYKGADN